MARRSTPTSSDGTQPPTGRVVDVDVDEEMRTSFLEYAYSVIYSRALPDARDGLKPVQRRILFQMGEMGLRPDRAHVKSARVVGDVMGRLHPHGDTAIYDALVRMAQDFSLRLPLIDGHGNFGSLDDGPAASRYCVTANTRVRLADGSSPRIGDLCTVGPDSDQDVDLEVLDKDGKRVAADRLFHSGFHPVLKLTTDSGHVLRGTGNHPVLCLVPVLGIPVLQWMRLDELEPGTVVALAREAWTTAVPTPDEWNRGVLAGAWVSEGWASTKRAGFNNTDPEFFRHVLRAYDEVIGGPRYTAARTLPSGKVIQEIDVQNTDAFADGPLKTMIEAKADAKSIPDYVWTDGPGTKRAFLMAAFEGDGSIANGPNDGVSVQYTTYSEQLAEEMLEMLLEFGVSARLWRNEKRGEIRLIISGRHNLLAFHHRIGFLTAKKQRLARRIESLTRTTHRLSRDHAPYVRQYLEEVLPAGQGRGTGRKWLLNHNLDRYERWQTERPLLLHKLKDPEVRAVISAVMDPGYRYVTVESVIPGGTEAVFSLRVQSEDHSFLAGGFVNHNTEARMAVSATAMVDGLDEDVVDFVPTYDNSSTQPSVLPSAIPNLLVNGASGIAVGMATNMPPHNLGEVVAAARHLIARPGATLEDLMRFVPGPDLPSGGRIVGLEGIRDAYATGRGTFRTRATARIEDITARRKGIVFTELPYAVGPEKVIEKVKDAVSAKKLLGVSAIDDFTDRQHGTRLVVEVKTGFQPEAVLEQLYRLTPLEDSFGINNVCLVEGQPRTLGLRELLQVFIDHRLEVVRRRSTHRLTKRRERLHLVEGLLIAVVDIDEVIQVIRTSDDGAAARTRLMEVFELSELQAEHILELRLRRLTRFSRIELETEREELLAAIAELEALLADEQLQREAVSDELAQVARDHGTPRRTVLLEAGAAPATAAVPLQVADDPCWVLLSATGLLARTGGAELSAGGPRTNHDVLRSTVRTTARGDVGALTSRGRVLRVGVVDTPVLPPTAGAPSLSGGAPLREFVSLEAGEDVVALVPLTPQPGDEEGAGLALATAQGVVKRVAAEPWGARDSWEVIGLDGSDAVVGAAWLSTGTEELVFVTSDAQLLRFSASLVRPQGRPARGMAGVRVTAGERVVAFSAVSAAEAARTEVVTVAAAEGALPGSPGISVKVAPFEEYPPKGRATGGVRCHRFLRGEGSLALAWVGPGPARGASATGAPVELPEPTGRRDGSGVPLAGALTAVAGSPVPAEEDDGTSVRG